MIAIAIGAQINSSQSDVNSYGHAIKVCFAFSIILIIQILCQSFCRMTELIGSFNFRCLELD